jgi:hypothetical protein
MLTFELTRRRNIEEYVLVITISDPKFTNVDETSRYIELFNTIDPTNPCTVIRPKSPRIRVSITPFLNTYYQYIFYINTLIYRQSVEQVHNMKANWDVILTRLKRMRLIHSNVSSEPIPFYYDMDSVPEVVTAFIQTHYSDQVNLQESIQWCTQCAQQSTDGLELQLVSELILDPVSEPVAEPVADPVESVAESVVEPVVEHQAVPEPVSKPVPESEQPQIEYVPETKPKTSMLIKKEYDANTQARLEKLERMLAEREAKNQKLEQELDNLKTTPKYYSSPSPSRSPARSPYRSPPRSPDPPSVSMYSNIGGHHDMQFRPVDMPLYNAAHIETLVQSIEQKLDNVCAKDVDRYKHTIEKLEGTVQNLELENAELRKENETVYSRLMRCEKQFTIIRQKYINLQQLKHKYKTMMITNANTNHIDTLNQLEEPRYQHHQAPVYNPQHQVYTTTTTTTNPPQSSRIAISPVPMHPVRVPLKF